MPTHFLDDFLDIAKSTSPKQAVGLVTAAAVTAGALAVGATYLRRPADDNGQAPPDVDETDEIDATEAPDDGDAIDEPPMAAAEGATAGQNRKKKKKSNKAKASTAASVTPSDPSAATASIGAAAPAGAADDDEGFTQVQKPIVNRPPPLSELSPEEIQVRLMNDLRAQVNIEKAKALAAGDIQPGRVDGPTLQLSTEAMRYIKSARDDYQRMARETFHDQLVGISLQGYEPPTWYVTKSSTSGAAFCISIHARKRSGEVATCLVLHVPKS